MDTLHIGDVQVDRVVEFTGPVGLTTEGFFPGSDPGVWTENSSWLSPEFVDPSNGMVQTAVQTWVVRSQGRTILIDTGLGNGKERPYVPVWSHYSSDYLGALAALGVTPEQVDVVINTHLHLDHVGWNTQLVDRSWVPTFPNATYVVNKTEFDFWNPANDSEPGFGRGNQNAFEDSVAPLQAADQLHLWDGSQHQLDSAITVELAAGHTPGAAVVTVESHGERALFAGDLLHSPLQVSHPDMDSCFCEDPTTARVSRRRLLAQAADQRALVLPAHFRGSGAVRVQRAGTDFALAS